MTKQDDAVVKQVAEATALYLLRRSFRVYPAMFECEWTNLISVTGATVTPGEEGSVHKYSVSGVRLNFYSILKDVVTNLENEGLIVARDQEGYLRVGLTARGAGLFQANLFKLDQLRLADDLP